MKKCPKCGGEVKEGRDGPSCRNGCQIITAQPIGASFRGEVMISKLAEDAEFTGRRSQGFRRVPTCKD